MTKAESLALSGLQLLTDAPNKALVHTCQHGHVHCALKFKGACSEEASERLSAELAKIRNASPTHRQIAPELRIYRAPTVRESAHQQIALF